MYIKLLIHVLAMVLAGAASAAPHVIRDLAYGDHPLQKIDVYLPDPIPQFAPPGAPVIVMVHGGAWMTGDKANTAVWQSKQAWWGMRGYALVSVNYRLLPEAAPQEQVNDVVSFISFS